MRTLCILALGLGLALSGCGAGTSGVTPAPTPTPDGTRFSPNYTDQFSSRRRWPQTALRVFVDRGEESRSLDTLKAVATTALQKWQAASGSRLTLALTDSSGDANIKVRFVRAILNDSGNPLGGNVIGLTTVSYSFASGQSADTATLTDASIQIKTGLSDATLLKNITHEFGHSFGIEGHSLSNADVMYAFAEPPTNITTSDINTLGYLYYLNWRSQKTGPILFGHQTIACP
jgi:predicted Zn-dependent protease